jgi:hypothetical protein
MNAMRVPSGDHTLLGPFEVEVAKRIGTERSRSTIHKSGPLKTAARRPSGATLDTFHGTGGRS